MLAERGLKPGDRLCVYLANCLEMIDLYLACVKLGVIFVPINILYRERELAHILTDAEPFAVVSATDFPVPRHFGTRGSHARSRGVAERTAANRSRRRCPRRHHLYFRHHRRVQRRHPYAQQFRRERAESS